MLCIVTILGQQSWLGVHRLGLFKKPTESIQIQDVQRFESCEAFTVASCMGNFLFLDCTFNTFLSLYSSLCVIQNTDIHVAILIYYAILQLYEYR